MSSAVVAVLEGDATLRRLLVETMQLGGYTVVAPADLDAPLAEAPPRVVLLDTSTANPVRLTRLQEQWGHVAVIALVDQVVDGAAVPAVATLEKPFDLDDLLALVRQYAGPN